MPVTPTTTVATTETKGAGSTLEISHDGGTVYAQIPGIESIPQVGAEGEFIEVTAIDETTRRYTDGIKTPPEWELAFRDIASNAAQDALIDAADAGDTVKVRVTYANGRRANFDLVLSGHFAQEVQLTGLIMHAVKGQVSGDIAWDKVA